MKDSEYFLAMPEKRVPLSPKVREPIKRHLDERVAAMGGQYGMQQFIVEAALLHFFDAPHDTQVAWIQKMQSAPMTGGTQSIVREIKARYDSAPPPPKTEKNDPNKRA